MAKLTKKQRAAADQKLVSGMSESMTKSAVLYLAGGKHTVGEVTAILQARIDAVAAAETAEATWHGLVEKAEATIEASRILVADLERALLAQFRTSPDVLTALGIALPKPRRALTGEESVLKAKRAAATRKARGTKGARQREAIKGTVADAPAPAPAPAPAVNGSDPTA